MSTCNKALVRRYLEEVVNGGDAGLLKELVAPGHVRHAADGDLYGPEGVRVELTDWRSAFPDMEIVVEELIAEQDRVVSRFLLRGTHAGPLPGLAPTGRSVAVGGIGVDRVVDGRLAESWVSLDALSLLRQLGALR